MKKNFCRKIATKRFAMLLALAGSNMALLGCASATTSAEWAEPQDLAGEFTVIDDSERQWSHHIDQLPIELHGAWPGVDAAQTAALIPLASTETSPAAAAEMVAKQRVVIYVGGNEVPQRADFCSLGKAYRNVVDNEKVTLRAALCDGPRIISYARQRFDGDSKLAAKDVAKLESSLVGVLHVPFNILDVEG